jgi:Tfp pilus assembly protein FimV
VIEAVEERNPPHFHVAVFPQPYTRYAQRQGGAGAVRVSTALRAQPAANARAGGRPVPRPAGGPTYTVRPGDTLWSIAQRNRVSVDNLKRANDLRSTRIVAGQVLRIPER